MIIFLYYFLLHFLLYFVFRLQFLIWNWNSLKTLNLSDYVIAFLYGARFDLAALSGLAGLFLIGWLWLDKFQIFKKIWFLIFGLLNLVIILLHFGDSELLNFTARRFTKSSLILLKEGGASNLILPYIPMAIFTFFFILSYLLILKIFSKKSISQYSIKQKVLFTLSVILLSIIGTRGGLQVKPITYLDAKIFDQSYANNLVLNSTFTLLKSFSKPSVERIHFFDHEKMLSLLNSQSLASQKVVTKNQNQINVVYIFLESFSKEYLDLENPEVTPYLNSLRAKSVDFKKAYANGRRSIEGVAALLSGIPALMEEPFINSEFSANQIIGLGTILNSNNYHTSFFHGAQNGSMHFDQFAKTVGIQNYYGKNEYPNQKDFDGTWGIFDEPYLKWVCQQLSTFKAPFFSSIFTLSSHQPYKIPDQYKSQFTDERLPILKSIQYADYALKEFMKCAESQKWFADTLFIFTADHTGPELIGNSSFESRFQVPLIFYSSNKLLLKNMNADQIAQHIDVVPTLLETLQIPLKNKNYLARSLWQSGPKVIALYADSKYQLVGDIQDESEQLKAIQQYFSEGLFDNRLYYPAK